jgi:hypothetical protein
MDGLPAPGYCDEPTTFGFVDRRITVPPANAGPWRITPGSTRKFQYVFRDPAGGPAGFNTTNAVSVTFCP